MTPWLIEKLFGPDPCPYQPTREVWPSPKESHAALVVDIDEVSNNYYCGKAVVVAGPPDEPRIIWEGPGCETRVAWLSETQVAYRRWIDGPDERELWSTFLVVDLVRQSVCFVLTPSFGANQVTIHATEKPEVWRLHVVPQEKTLPPYDMNVSACAMVWKPWNDVDGAKRATWSQLRPADPGWEAREKRRRLEPAPTEPGRQWHVSNPLFTVMMIIMWLVQPVWTLSLVVRLLVHDTTILWTVRGILAMTIVSAFPACMGVMFLIALLWRGGLTPLEKRNARIVGFVAPYWFVWPMVWHLVLRALGTSP